MSEPTFIPLATGNPSDDDAQVIDDMLRPNPMGLTPEQMAISPVVEKKKEPAKPTRIVNYAFTLASGAILDNPVQVAWPDPNRVELHVSVNGAAADSFYFADETTKLALLAGGQATRLYGGQNRCITGFTGPLFIKTNATVATGEVTFQCFGVTK